MVAELQTEQEAFVVLSSRWFRVGRCGSVCVGGSSVWFGVDRGGSVWFDAVAPSVIAALLYNSSTRTATQFVILRMTTRDLFLLDFMISC